MATPPETRYRLVGTRQDGTKTTVLGSMTHDEAARARQALDAAGIFASVEIVLDSDRPAQ